MEFDDELDGDFNKELYEWINCVNDLINYEEIILDKRLFEYNENAKKYLLNPDTLKTIINAKYCIIGDNPGQNEKIYREYFYRSEDKRTAGYKINKMLESDNVKGFIFFNKCLISTPRTSDLKSYQIEKTKKIVTDFLNIIKKYNHNLKFLFLGVNEKFKKIYFLLNNEVLKDSILQYHPCSSKFCVDFKKLEKNDVENLLYKKYPILLDVISDENSNDNFDDESDDDSDDGECPTLIPA